MRPEPGQVLHFSPDYWFPRQCPRAMAWMRTTTTDRDRIRIIGPGCGDRVHAIEYGWLEAMRTVRLYAYRLPAAYFQPVGAPELHAQVAVEPVEPLGPPEPVGDLLERHAEAGIQLRVLNNLWPFWDVVVTTTVGFSGIRLGNAIPRPRTGPGQPA